MIEFRYHDLRIVSDNPIFRWETCKFLVGSKGYVDDIFIDDDIVYVHIANDMDEQRYVIIGDDDMFFTCDSIHKTLLLRRYIASDIRGDAVVLFSDLFSVKVSLTDEGEIIYSPPTIMEEIKTRKSRKGLEIH